MRIGSLFSGAGGLDLAALELFDGAGMAWHCEVDPAASKVLAHHWPDVPNLGDVTAIDWATVEPIDILTGGFPCQDVSLAGRRAGMTGDTRSGLWSHMATAIDVLRPQYVLIENVRGLLSARANRPNSVAGTPCVCRWIDRWRGLDRTGSQEERWQEAELLRQGQDRNDSCGAAGNAVVSSAMGRIADELSPSDRPQADSVDLVGHWNAGRDSTASSRAVPPYEEPSGPVGLGGGADQIRSPAPPEWQWGMDLARACRVRSDHGETAPSELARFGCCSKCGGFVIPGAPDSNVESGSDAVGGRPDGHVLRAAGAVLGNLAGLGYDAEWTCVRASDVGACHQRLRVFILAHPANSTGQCSTNGPVGSDELPIVAVAGAGDGADARRAAERVHQLGGGAAIVARGPVAMLPTPRASDGTKGGPNQRGSRGDLMLPSPVAQLLPTPRALDGAGGPNPIHRAERMDDVETRIIRLADQWGAYAPAIRRQELLSRPAPAPTEPNSKGNPRLSANFAEWLMFWPAGWVTDPAIGLSRNDQLRIIGNGVVPPQAAAAFRRLLDVTASPIGGAA